MYSVRDASVAHSLMGQRLQPSNSSLLLSEYFLVCKLFSDTATARTTHQRYVAQIESMRSIFATQTLRSSEQNNYTDTSSNGGVHGAAGSGSHHGLTSSRFPTSSQAGSSATSAASPASTEKDGLPPALRRPLQRTSSAHGGDRLPPVSAAARQRSGSAASTSERLAAQGHHDSTESWQSPPQRLHSSGKNNSGGASRGTGTAFHSPAEVSTRSPASYAIFRREWGPESYHERFQKPWNAFLNELADVMMDVVTAWVSDSEERTSPACSRHLVRRSSTCCYDAAHGMCLLRWNTMREVRAYVDALHAVVNAPLSQFCVPLTLGMEVLGVPVLCMSLAPVSGPWQAWDTVGMVWHSFCGLCATLRLMRPLDRVEGGRGEAVTGLFLGGQTGSAAVAGSDAAEADGTGNVLEEGSVGWSLLRQLEPPPGGNDYCYTSVPAGIGFDAGALPQLPPPPPPPNAGGSTGQWPSRRNSVFYSDPTSLTGAATGGYDRVGRQALAAAAAGQGGHLARNGGPQLTPAIGADARWYFIDARAICLYQWYARASWQAARVPRREMYLSEGGCVQRAMGPNKLILQSKLRIMVHQLLNGLMGGGSGASAAHMNMRLTSYLTRDTGSGGSGGDGGGDDNVPAVRRWGRRMPPTLLSTLCHSHGVRYGTYVYAIVDLLRTEKQTLSHAVQAAYRHGSSSPNTQARLAQCHRCIQAVIGELIARATKHLIYQEWYTTIRQHPDWLYRFHAFCAAASEAAASDEATAPDAPATAAHRTTAGSGASELPPSGPAPRAEQRIDDTDTVGSDRRTPAKSDSAGGSNSDKILEPRRENTPSGGLGDGSLSAAATRRRRRALLETERNRLGAPLLDAVRRVVNGVFTVNATAIAVGRGSGSGEADRVSAGAASERGGASGGGGAAAHAVPAARTSTDEAGRPLAAGNGNSESGGYPFFNPALRGVAFQPDMFEELLLAVNEQYVVRPYSGGEKASEWQLLHKSAPVVSRRGQRTHTSGAAADGGGNGGGFGVRAGTNGGGNAWVSQSARDAASAAGVAAAAGAAAASRQRERSANPSRLYGAGGVWYPAADEESIQVEPHDLYPGWSLQCLQEMIGIPLVVRQTGVDVEEGFSGADMLRALPPFSDGWAHGLRRPSRGVVSPERGRPPPLASGCPLRSAVWGTTLELPLCLRSGTVEGALEYAQQQREVGMAIVSSGHNAPLHGSGGRRGGAAAAVWGERNPHMAYMGKQIQLHAADVRIACRGWPITEDFDFLKQTDHLSDVTLSRAGDGERHVVRHRSWESPLMERQRHSAGRSARVDSDRMLVAAGANVDDTRMAVCFAASMHWRLCILNAKVDLHEAMSAMWHLTECTESTYGSHTVCGYLLRCKIELLTTMARHFTTSGVTTALEAAVADLDVLTGGLLNFSPVQGDGPVLAPPSRGSLVASPSRRNAPSPRGTGGSAPPGEALEHRTSGPHTPSLPLNRADAADTFDDTTVVAHDADGTGAASPAPMSPNSSGAASPQVARLRSFPPPPPITQRQAAVVAVAVAVAAANRSGGTGAAATAANPLAGGAAPRYPGGDGAGELASPVGPRAANSADALLSATAATRKSYHLRSVQCVDLYATLLALLTRHMLLPEARRTPHESLSRAVMFCSLRRELIVLTHGEHSVEAAMAAGDVGLLLLQNPKTWEQAKAEFYRAKRSIQLHLRSGTGNDGDGEDEEEEEDAPSGERARRASWDAVGTTMSPSLSSMPPAVGAAGDDGGCAASAYPSATPPPHTGIAVSSSSSPSSSCGVHGRRESRVAWSDVSRDVWTATPDRLKQALCSVLNNIAYVFCRQAQRQYLLSQKSIVAFVRRARRHHTAHKPGTGYQLRELWKAQRAKVEQHLGEAAGTLRHVLHHANDVPVYDYAVALNNQACVLLFRRQHTAAKRLLLQSLSITMQLRSVSVARVPLPLQLVSAKGSGDTAGSALWFVSPPLPAPSASLSSSAAHQDRGLRTVEVPVDSSLGSGAVEGRDWASAESDARASMTTNPAVHRPTLSAIASRLLLRSPHQEEAASASTGPTMEPSRAPKTIAVIAAMLRHLGVVADEDQHGRLVVEEEEEGAAQGYYYVTGGAPSWASSSPEQLRSCQIHTLRMLYRVEVEKGYLDSLRLRQLLRRYLASWRERRRQRHAQAAEVLYRVGVGAVTRVYLARRYRFSGYHWWFRQPAQFCRHLDPLLNTHALSTRRQLWDVWNLQVETSTYLLQRVLRAAAVRMRIGVQHQFIQFYLRRCRPAVEAAVWSKRGVLFASIMIHQHVHVGLQAMARLHDAVQSGTLWVLSLTERLADKLHAVRITTGLRELQARESIRRQFLVALARLGLDRLLGSHAEEVATLSRRDSRSSRARASQSTSRSIATPSATGTAAAAVTPEQSSVQTPPFPSPTNSLRSSGGAPLPLAPPCLPGVVGGPGVVSGLEHTGSAAVEAVPSPPHRPSTPVKLAASVPRPHPPLVLSLTLGGTSAAPSTPASRTRRVRQVRIQADVGDLDSDGITSPMARAVHEERHRLMQRQYREDERVKMAQLRVQRWSPTTDEETTTTTTTTTTTAGAEEHVSPALLCATGTGVGDTANAKWRQALQRASDPRWAALPGSTPVSPAAAVPAASDGGLQLVHVLGEPNTGAAVASPFPLSHSPPPIPRDQSSQSLSSRLMSGQQQQQQQQEQEQEESTTSMASSLSSRRPSSAAVSTTSSRVAAVAAEAHHNQLVQASHLLLQFWWQRRALPTYAAASVELHRVYDKHCAQLHEQCVARGAATLRLHALAIAEMDDRRCVLQLEAVETASLLLLQLYSARWCRSVESHTRGLRRLVADCVPPQEHLARPTSRLVTGERKPGNRSSSSSTRPRPVAHSVASNGRPPPEDLMWQLRQWLQRSEEHQ